MLAPTIIAQLYLSTAAGKLTKIGNVGEMDSQHPTKYYVVKTHYIDKQHVLVHRRAEVSGKNDEHLNFYIDVVCPILPKAPNDIDSSQSSSIKIKAWLGTEYSKGLSNRSSDEEKEQAFKDFGAEVQKEFDEANLDSFVYLDKIGNNDRRKGFISAIKSVPQLKIIDPVILEAKNEPFAARNGNKLAWIFYSITIGSAIFFFMLMFPKIDYLQIKKLPKYSLNHQLRYFYSLLSLANLRRTSSAPIVIVTLNIVVFLAMVFAGFGFISVNGPDLYNWGANYRPAVLDGQWWRLFTNVFMHGGIMHLLFNMYGLLLVSAFLQSILNQTQYVISYLVCGLAASLASIWWHAATLSVGASGAIFGLYGVLTALATTNKFDAGLKKPMLLNNALFIGINLLVGISGGIDNAAHIGGLVAGVIMGYILYFFIDDSANTKSTIITDEPAEALQKHSEQG
ncbi:rhomboid family intramembrane serine protease [Mucilaginibacter sp. CSA2-8R]|uniref:rhomboid family intramembrane serine protease n=1 Tax=Mucilaginibacter sp. CSA2-8R TaxID=3141542 RepID=UPI00315D2274